MDNVDSRPPNTPRLVNPIKEGGNFSSIDLSRQVGELYRSHYLFLAESDITDDDARTKWAEMVNTPSPFQAPRAGALQLQRLLDDSIVNIRSVGSLIPNSPLKFRDHIVPSFLLQVFGRDSRISARSPEKRLNQIFANIANDLDANGNNEGSGLPLDERVAEIRQHFAVNGLPVAIEFFLIEPALLPTIPKERPDEIK